MEQIRDGFVREAFDLARAADVAAAQARLDHAAQVWPLEPEQVDWVQRALDDALATAGLPPAPLRDPNRFGD